MDRKILKEYEQACAIIRETEGRMEKMRETGKDREIQSIRGSIPRYPFRNTTIHMSAPTREYRIDNLILKWQVERSREIKAAVEEEMKTAPLRIQRIIQYKYFEGMTWEDTAKEIGGNATAESIRKELDRFLKKL